MVLTGFEGRGTLVSMFERFTPDARHAVVQAQEEARRLKHNYIGTEHILLGLLGVTEGRACRVLTGVGLSLEGTRDEVVAIVDTGGKMPSGHIPFTPRAKKTLELSLREALQLHHESIGTEHILLGLIREGDGVAAQILRQHADLLTIRVAVLDLLPAGNAEATHGRRWLRRHATAEAETGGSGEAAGQSVLSATPAADTTLSEAARLAGAQPVGSHHLLLAALADPDSAAARALATLGVDVGQAREVLAGVDVTGTSDEPSEEAGRRQMIIRVTDERLTIEASDPVIIRAGRAALQALGDTADPAGSIRGDRPECAGLSRAWQALLDGLQSIQQRAGTPAEPPAGPGEPGTEAA
jgi:ATP-dependent Clp protease ATP-binding subunit ClpA